MSKKIDIREAVCSLQRYWNTYQNQVGYDACEDETFLADALFGIGRAALPNKYDGYEGFQLFKKDLMQWLLKDHLKRGGR